MHSRIGPGCLPSWRAFLVFGAGVPPGGDVELGAVSNQADAAVPLGPVDALRFVLEVSELSDGSALLPILVYGVLKAGESVDGGVAPLGLETPVRT